MSVTLNELETVSYSHESNTEPLYAKLNDSEKSSSTFQSLQFFATTNSSSRWRDGKDVGETRCSRRSAQEHKIWRYAFSSASGYDTVVLRQI